MSNQSVGLLGEWRASLYLKRQGMSILARRYRTSHGEIDLIVRDQRALVFVEVKARSGGHIGDGARAVNAEKQRHLRFAARQYLREHPADEIRFDVVEIGAAGIRHIKNAF